METKEERLLRIFSAFDNICNMRWGILRGFAGRRSWHCALCVTAGGPYSKIAGLLDNVFILKTVMF